MKIVKKDKKNLGIVSSIILMSILSFDLSSSGGSIKFYAKWIKCGQKPVRLLSKPGMRWHEESKSSEFTRSGYQDYKCTAEKLKEQGILQMNIAGSSDCFYKVTYGV